MLRCAGLEYRNKRIIANVDKEQILAIKIDGCEKEAVINKGVR